MKEYAVNYNTKKKKCSAKIENEKEKIMGIILNEDCTDFLYTRKPEEMNEENLRKQIDFYAQFGLDTLVFNGNAQKSFYLSDVLEPIWKDIVEKGTSMYYRDRELTPRFAHMVRNAKLLNQNVPDYLGYRIRYGGSLGMKIFLGMRMNDCHCVDTNPDHPLITDMWREHQDWLTMPFTSFFWGRTFDYARKEVYDFHLAVMKEYLTKFDPDGLELDWMRSPCYFQPGTEEQNAHILTEFMREARKAADECARRNCHVRRSRQPIQAVREWYCNRSRLQVPVLCRRLPDAFQNPAPARKRFCCSSLTAGNCIRGTICGHCTIARFFLYSTVPFFLL